MSGPGRPADSPDRPRSQPWEWRIDPAPPRGPDREPTPDPAGAEGVDADGIGVADTAGTDADGTDADGTDRWPDRARDTG